MSVAVVTDSTADLPESTVSQLGIVVVPLHVFFGDHEYADGFTIGADEFYARLTTPGTQLPRTSAPSAGEFADAYRELLRTRDQVVSLHLAQELSATHASAVVARNQSPDSDRITVLDSRSASAGLGLITIEAATLARDGASADEICALVHSIIPRTRFFGAVDTLEYLRRGGRIGRAAALLGSMLQVKPLVGLQDGSVYPIERVRGRTRALGRIRQLLEECGALWRVAVGHTTDEKGMYEVERFVQQHAPGLPILRFQCGATLGTYLGPGAFGLAVIQKD